MAHVETMSGRFSRLCARPLLALLLGALACGDGGAMNPPATGTERVPGDPRIPAAANTPADPAPGAAEAPSAPGAASTANASEENVAQNPILQGGESSPPNAGTASDDRAAEAPAEDAPASDPNGPAPTRESATGPGPFPVLTVSTGLRDGPEYGSQTLHVPEGAPGPLASVAIVPGFNTPESSIQAWGPFLASHGIVTLTIGTNNPADSAEVRARAVLDALVTIQAENVRAGGPVEGELDLDRLGIMGWSLGGGGVLAAASRTPSLKAAITMAAFGPGAQFPNDQVPTLFLAGSADTSAGGQSQGMFASLPDTTPKMLFEVRGGPHEVGNDPANAGGEIGRYGLSWLEVFLVGDERYRQFLVEAPAQASDFQQNLSGAP